MLEPLAGEKSEMEEEMEDKPQKESISTVEGMGIFVESGPLSSNRKRKREASVEDTFSTPPLSSSSSSNQNLSTPSSVPNITENYILQTPLLSENISNLNKQIADIQHEICVILSELNALPSESEVSQFDKEQLLDYVKKKGGLTATKDTLTATKDALIAKRDTLKDDHIRLLTKTKSKRFESFLKCPIFFHFLFLQILEQSSNKCMFFF